MKKIHILCVVRWLVGGIRTYLNYMYGELDPDKYSFTILTGPSDEISTLQKDLNAFDIKLIICSSRAANFSLAKHLILLMSKTKYDLIHTQGFTAGIITSLINSVFRFPNIMTFHGILGYEGEEDLSGRFGNIKRKILTLSIKHANIINVVSYDAKENLLEYLPGLKTVKEKILVIQNGINIKKFTSGKQCPDLKAKLGMNESAIILGYMGRFMPRKGFMDLVKAVDHLKKKGMKETQIQVLTVGGGRFFNQYKKEIRDRDLNGYFKHLEFQPNIFGILKNIDLLVMPSYWETWGLLAAESLIAGTPVLAYGCIGLREVLTDTPAIIVETGNTAQLASGIEEYCRFQDQYQSHFQSYILKAKERFKSKDASIKLETALRSLVEKV